MADITYIPIRQLYPHPDNPRKELGDLSELAASIKENGVYQNLTVIPGHYLNSREYIAKCVDEGGDAAAAAAAWTPKAVWSSEDYTIIIGHRRAAAAQQAGLYELPCAIVEMDEREQIQTMMMQSIRSAIRGLQRWIADLNEKKQLLLDALEKAKEPTLSDLLVDYFNLRNEQRSDWSGKAKLKCTVRDFEEVKRAVEYLKAHSLNTVEDLNQAIDSLNQTAAPLRRQLKQNENRMRAIAQIKDAAAVHAKLKPIHDIFIKKNFKLTKDAYAAQHKEELDTFNKAVRTLMKLNGSTAVDFSALDAEFSALQSSSAELRTQLETLQPDISALKNVRKYIDMVLNKQQLSAPGGKTPEKKSVLKTLNDSKAALEQKKLQPQQKATEHTL